MGILLGLAAALSWGVSDFLGGICTHRVGTYRTFFYMQLAGFIGISAVLPALGGWGRLAVGWAPWGWALLAGAVNFISTMAMIKSFEIGKMSVVVPITASYPALVLLLTTASGERLTALRATAIFVMIAGVVLVVSTKERADVTRDARGHSQWMLPLGVGWAIVAGVGFGFLFWLLGYRAIPVSGSAQVLWVIRLTCVTAALFLTKPLGITLRLAKSSIRWVLLVAGMLDSAAFLACNFGLRTEQVAVVTVLVSLYGVVTVSLAAIVLRERLAAWQWLGIVCVFAGIGMISLR